MFDLVSSRGKQKSYFCVLILPYDHKIGSTCSVREMVREEDILHVSHIFKEVGVLLKVTHNYLGKGGKIEIVEELERIEPENAGELES